jgi:hypothetical protein
MPFSGEVRVINGCKGTFATAWHVNHDAESRKERTHFPCSKYGSIFFYKYDVVKHEKSDEKSHEKFYKKPHYLTLYITSKLHLLVGC